DALANDGIDVEVIDPRTLNPLDTETLLESVRRTGRLCIVHEDTQTMGLGAEIAAVAAERALTDLRATVNRIAMPDVAGIRASGPMEEFLIPYRERIAVTLRELARVDHAQSSTNGIAVAARSAEPSAPGWLGMLEASNTEVPQASSVVEIDLTRVHAALEAS